MLDAQPPYAAASTTLLAPVGRLLLALPDVSAANEPDVHVRVLPPRGVRPVVGGDGTAIMVFSLAQGHTEGATSSVRII